MPFLENHSYKSFQVLPIEQVAKKESSGLFNYEVSFDAMFWHAASVVD